MQDYIDSLVEARNRAWHQAKETIQRASDAGRELDAEERSSVDRAFEDIDRLDKDIKDFGARVQTEREGDIAREAYSGIIRPAQVMAPAMDEFDAFLRGNTGARSIDVDLRGVAQEKRLIRSGVGARELRDLTVGSATAGGNLVPTGFARQLYDFLEVYSGMRRTNATILTTSGGEAFDLPRVTAHGTAAAVAEGSALAEVDPTVGKMTLNAYKYGQLVQISSELLADSGVDIVGFVATDLGRALARVTDTDYVLGNGSSKPQGVMTAIGTAVTGGTGVAGVPTIANLIDLVYSVNSDYRENGAQFLMRDATAGKIRQLTTTDGQFLWQPAVTAGEPDRLLGYPVITDPNVVATAVNANSIAFGDFSAFYIRDVGAVRIERSDEYAFANDMATWRAILRTDSDLIDTNAIKLYRGGTA